MAALAGTALAWSYPVMAAAMNMRRRVGFLGFEPADGPHPELDAFLAGMRELGYVEGENIQVERRMAGGQEILLPSYAAELVALRVECIVAFAPTIGAAIAATRSIPIVIRTSVDPVQAGYVASLARPGGNVTGVSSYTGNLYGKRLDLLRDLAPGLMRVGVLWNDVSRSAPEYFAATNSAAKSIGLEIVSLSVHRSEDFEAAFASAKRARVGALMPLRDPVVVYGRARIAELAQASRLPAVYDERRFCEANGLMCYGANLVSVHRRAAYYVHRILAGAKPSELPVEEPTTFELVINLRAAKAIGLAIPPTLLARADEVIE